MSRTFPLFDLEHVAGIAGLVRWVELSEEHPRALQLAGCCGEQFESWVGQPEAWAEAFRRTNNLLKHEPTYQPQPDELRELASSGHFLLAAALLDRAAGTKEPSHAIFGHHQLRDLGERLRHRY